MNEQNRKRIGELHEGDTFHMSVLGQKCNGVCCVDHIDHTTKLIRIISPNGTRRWMTPYELVYPESTTVRKGV